MSDLDRALRELLTDDRLDVPVRPDATRLIKDGVRRRRRNRRIGVTAGAVIAAGAATVVTLTATGVEFAQTSPAQPGPTPPQQITKPPAPSAAETVPWAYLPYDAAKPLTLPGTIADPAVPWCTTAQLTATAGDFQGATGSAAGAVAVRNTGATCALQGVPGMTGYGDNDKLVALAQPADDFQLHPWVKLQPNATASASVQIFGDGSRCIGPVRRLAVDIGHGQPPVTATASWVGNREVQPRCGTAEPTHQLDHYTINVGDWRNPDGGPPLLGAEASADASSLPATILPGSVLHYVVHTTGVPKNPCLPYRQRLVSVNPAHTVIASVDLMLNCDAIPTTANGAAFDMEVYVSTAAPSGYAELTWELPTGATASGELQIVPAPPRCTQDQISLRSGSDGAATTHYRRNIVLTNVSSTPCSLRGYPGVRFVDASGTTQPTDQRNGASFMWSTHETNTVALEPGGTASFAIAGYDYDAAANQACPTAYGVEVIPPGQRQGVVVHVDWPHCFNGQVDVSPVVPGSNGPR